jgi:hypothetical protein
LRVLNRTTFLTGANMTCRNNPSDIVEQADTICRLQQAGYGELLFALADPTVYARAGSGRLVMAALAKRLGVGPKRAKRMLDGAKAAVQ